MRKLFFIVLLLSFSVDLYAQNKSIDGELFITTNFGYSTNSVIFLGKTPDTQSFFTYFGFGKRIKTPISSVHIFVTRGFIPFIEYRYPKRDEGSKRDIVAGLGISPLGYTLIKPFKYFDFETGIKSGINIINKTFPTDKGRQLNYSFDIKVAIQRKLIAQTYLSLGYKFHHISNAQTGKENPGIDSNFLFFSIKQF